MPAIVPLACFVLIATCVYQISGQHPDLSRWRHSFLTAALLWGVVVVVITECLSLFHALNFAWILSLWVMACVGAFAASMWSSLRGPAQPILFKGVSIPLFAVLTSAGVAVIAAILGLVAWLAPASTADALMYHLPRVENWIQLASVAHYPTNDVRQLYDPPWAEYAILHFRLLSSGDRFSTCVEWFSMAGSCIGVSAIARQLGADVRGQALAALVAATIPMGILQASSPLNDYVEAFWIVCLAYFALAVQSEPRWTRILGVGASLGLALLTKGTGYIFALPILAWLGIWAAMQIRWQAARMGLVVGAVALALNAGLYVRNQSLFGNPLGPENSRYANQIHTPSALTCNLIRDVSLEFGTSYPAVNHALMSGISATCQALGLNPSDPRITLVGPLLKPFQIVPLSTYETLAGNPIQFLLILGTLALCLSVPRLRKDRAVLAMALVVIGGYALFCIYLRWQLWGNRLLLPWFVLASALVGVATCKLSGGRVAATSVLAIALMVASSPWLLTNQARPIVGTQNVFTIPRMDQYFIRAPALEQPYLDGTRYLESLGCRQVGFLGGKLTTEYPLWMLLNRDGTHIFVEHVGVDNQSAALYRDPPFAGVQPCAIFSPDGSAVRTFAVPGSSDLVIAGRTYQRAWASGGVFVFVPR